MGLKAPIGDVVSMKHLDTRKFRVPNLSRAAHLRIPVPYELAVLALLLIGANVAQQAL